MGGPSKQDYAPTAAEKMQASVAKAQYDRNKKLFAPVQKAFVASAEQNLNPTFRGMANADTAQALNPLSDYGATTGVAEGGALYAAAMTNQLSSADKASTDTTNKRGADAMEAIQNKSGITTGGIANVSEISNSNKLADARNSMLIKDAQINAAMKVGGAAIGTGFKNLEGGGTFFRANANENRMGQINYGQPALNSSGTGYQPPSLYQQDLVSPFDFKRNLEVSRGRGTFGGYNNNYGNGLGNLPNQLRNIRK